VARPERRFACGTCGATSIRWEGQCRSCGEWNTLVEVPASDARRTDRQGAVTVPAAVALARVDGGDTPHRLRSGIGELDRVLGGGLVPGSVVLLGGEPGIGKSTLVLALAAAIAGGGAERRVLYASGEESAAQLRLRAVRLGLADGPVADSISVLTETAVERVVAAAEASSPALLVLDSIQAVTAEELDGPAGSVGQVRAAAARVQAYAKERSVPVVLVGHVTKDGSLAGPKTLEHLVDVVLTLEGERYAGLRLLRAQKNRFGSTEEVGVFEMAAAGLREVPDPAASFLEPASLGAPGVAVGAALEGTRPLLVEVQALVASQAQGSPRRTVSGLDPQRLALILAVLGRRAGLNLASHDVYASLVGGLTIEEPAMDLPLALALASSLRDRPLVPGTVSCGEIGLTGEIRAVAGLERRLREAARLGFVRAIVAGGRPAEEAVPAVAGLEVVRVATLRDAVAAAVQQTPTDEGNRGMRPTVLGSPTR
jgi:DNA repair protein RadA/Sms